MQRCDDDVAAGLGEVGAGADDAEIETAVEQQAGEALRRPLTVGRDHDAELLHEQVAEPVGEAFTVAHHGSPAAGTHHRRVG